MPRPKKFLTYYVPDERTLAALGKTAVCHAHMEDQLIMVLKSLESLKPKEARKKYRTKPISHIRQEILRLAKLKIPPAPYKRLERLIKKSQTLSDKRNSYLHDTVITELDGPAQILTKKIRRQKMPSIEKINGLSDDIQSFHKKLNIERLEGFLAKALI